MECSEEDMYKITGYQFDWRRVGRRLLSDQNVRDIDIEGGSEREKRDKMLIEWKRTKSRNATYQALVKELRAIGNNATADRVEELEWKNKQQDSNSMVCNDEDICTIAGYQFDWRLVGRRLLCDQSVRDINIEGGSEREKKNKMLIEWKRTKSRDATYQALVKVLRAIENNAAADRVEELEWKNKQQASNSMVCNDEDIYTIAGCEFDWRHVGQRLLRGQKLRDIDNDGGSEREKREKMLLEWRRTKSHEATYQALVKVLQTVENNATAIRVEDFKSQGYNIPDDLKKCCCDVYTIEVNENRCTHTDDRHGFSITFPPGCLEPNLRITLTIGVMMYGPFQFPDDVTPVSPLLWVFGDTEDVRLLKNATIVLPHCLDIDEKTKEVSKFYS
eukprot:Em0001g2687a